MSTFTPHSPVPGNLSGTMIDGEVRLTNHAKYRWNDRAPRGFADIGVAWRLGVEAPDEICDMMVSDNGDTPDRMRAYRDSNRDGEQVMMIFVCSDEPNPTPSPGWTNVVTCYPAHSMTEQCRRVRSSLWDLCREQQDPIL